MILPKVIATSVVRSTQQGESHGGVFVVNLESASFEKVIDWNDPGIDWQGRGSDRGLRGIAIYRENIYLAASDEIFVYDSHFKLQRSFRNRYLKHCHEICLDGDILYLTSTGWNAVLEFDLLSEKFVRGYQLIRRTRLAQLLTSEYAVKEFDPSADGADLREAQSSLHLNNVSRYQSLTHLSGTKIDSLVQIRAGQARSLGRLPLGTHNAALTSDGVIYNDTASGSVVLADENFRVRQRFPVPAYAAAELTHTDIPRDHARQGFARGLIVTNDGLIIGGSSPSTITAYSVERGKQLRSVNLSKDIRNCIHGLELWPF